MEYKINEKFDYNGVRLIAVEVAAPEQKCKLCYFSTEWGCCREPKFSCMPHNRSDRTHICFCLVADEISSAAHSEDSLPSVKNDRLDGKPMWELLPLPDVEDIVRVYTFGAKKYGPNTWRSLPDGMNRYKAALMRHLTSFDRGDEIDEESGLPALAHMAWNAIAMLSLWHDANREQEAPGTSSQNHES